MDSASWDKKEVDKYVILNKVLGRGNQAIVFEAYIKETRQPVAAKVFDRKLLQQNNQQKNVIRQINMQNRIKHPYILDCYEIKTTSKNIYFFMEFCDGGDLENHLKTSGFLSETECVDFFQQITEAFLLLEQNKIVHRDLKPANILLKNGQLKIADFGFAKEIIAKDDENETMCSTQTVENTYVGSPIFMSPQALDRTKNYNLLKSDVWSAGICLYLMLYKRYPFFTDDINKLKETIQNAPLTFPTDPQCQRSSAIKDLLSHMLDKDETTRYSWKQVKAHRCLAQQSEEYQKNPLLGSLEMNQITGISGFNHNLKNINVIHIEEGSESGSSKGTTPETSQQQSNSQELSFVQPSRDRMKEIHCLLRIQSQFALIYRIVWKGFFQLLQFRSLLQQQAASQGTKWIPGALDEQNIRNAIILLMNALLLKEGKFLRDLVENPQGSVTYRIRRHMHNLQYSQTDFNAYFHSEAFNAFHENLRITYQTDTMVSFQTYLNIFSQHLQAAGFTENLTEDKCNEHIRRTLSILNTRIQALAQEAAQETNKTGIILILYLFFLQKNEARLQNFVDPIEHYSQLLKSLEMIGFMDIASIYAQIQTYIQADLQSDSEESDMDEVPDADTERYS